jgi:hypothetical protein
MMLLFWRRACSYFPAELPDVSQQVLDAWSACLNEVPAIGDLMLVLNTPLGHALPFPSSWAGRAFLPAIDVAMEQAALLMPEIHAVLDVIFACVRRGTSEDSVHHLYDSLITGVLGLLQDHVTLGLRMDRNTPDKSRTTKGQSRPDFLCWLPSGILAFKGEEKATQEDLHIARDELCTKLAAWSATFFGELPYQLAYAAGGEMIQFFALDLRQNGRRVPLCDAFTITTPRARSQCVRMVVNIFRVLRTLHKRFPDHCLSLGSVVEKQDSCVVTICGDYVKKRATAFTGPVLVELYNSLVDSPIECLARPKKAPSHIAGSLTVKLQPVGFFRNPSEEVRLAARAVLTALCGLHARGWVHRDVRSTNIMEVPGDGWYLMDLEWAEKVGEPLGDYRPKRENSPPEVLRGGNVAIWTSSADMWQFGRVLELWEERGSPLGNLGHQLCAALLTESPANRPTAEKALNHPWFS